MKGLSPLTPDCVLEYPVKSKLSGPSAEQVPTFRSLHTDHHPSLFPQIPDFQQLQGGETSKGQELGAL